MGISAFTSFYDGISNRLINSATLISGEKSYKTNLALWDTGATCTCISKNVVEQLNLVPCGQRPMQTVSDQKIVNEYRMDIKLQNEDVCLKNIFVVDSEIGEQGIDLLIGMDIIGLGDFSVSNYNGKTVFTFRIPSQVTTDYVKVLNSIDEMKNNKKIGRNDLCPCGSGQKFKKCCGR